jgi:hypothetical protein
MFADEQPPEERPADKAVASHGTNTNPLANTTANRQARAERRPVVDHRRALIGPGQQRQLQHDADHVERDPPDRRVQVDVKFLEPPGVSRKKHYQFTAIDDCTRIRILRTYDRNNQTTADELA